MPEKSFSKCKLNTTEREKGNKITKFAFVLLINEILIGKPSMYRKFSRERLGVTMTCPCIHTRHDCLSTMNKENDHRIKDFEALITSQCIKSIGRHYGP